MRVDVDAGERVVEDESERLDVQSCRRTERRRRRKRRQVRARWREAEVGDAPTVADENAQLHPRRAVRRRRGCSCVRFLRRCHGTGAIARRRRCRCRLGRWWWLSRCFRRRRIGIGCGERVFGRRRRFGRRDEQDRCIQIRRVELVLGIDRIVGFAVFGAAQRQLQFLADHLAVDDQDDIFFSSPFFGRCALCCSRSSVRRSCNTCMPAG